MKGQRPYGGFRVLASDAHGLVRAEEGIGGGVRPLGRAEPAPTTYTPQRTPHGGPITP